MECGVPAEKVVGGNSLAFIYSMRPLVISAALIEEGAVVGEEEGLETTLVGEAWSVPLLGVDDSACICCEASDLEPSDRNRRPFPFFGGGVAD